MHALASDALQQQWRAVAVNGMALNEMALEHLFLEPTSNWHGLQRLGALQPTTLTALKSATAFAWSGPTALAVSQAAQTLPEDVTMSEFLVSSDGSRSGWWFFAQPMAIPTPHQHDVVIALLWKRERGPDGKGRTWFSTFCNEHGGPTPTLAWVWNDGETIAEMSDSALKHLRQCEPGDDAPPVDECAAAARWFGCFFAAGMTWLRQKIAVPEVGEVGRGARRRLQREHDLSEIPKVMIVELRRRASRSSTNDGTGASVEWSRRWIVSGHWRNQWYPGKGVHAPRFIEPYVKGPDDKPLTEKIRVYSVSR
tara:strand:- start:833 stop:1762 length:930 start_codon:yes stop_codon:yes gene_type:complete